MALQISIPSGQYDSSGNMINATYWRVYSINANIYDETFSMHVYGYASAAAYAANPQQAPLMSTIVYFPDVINAPNVTAWPFSPAALQAAYPNNPNAVLLAAQAYCQNYPMFMGSTPVA
jgi:hypothetical protein